MKKEELAEKARKHREYTIKEYSEKTLQTFSHTKIYFQNYKFETPDSRLPDGIRLDIPVTVCDMTSEIAISKYHSSNKDCVLNFASFTRPGGGFLSGSMAQEEALCHSSNLYDVLIPFKKYYDDNYKYYRRGGLYTNWAIYSPRVIFNGGREIDVITCAAPNFSAYSESKSRTMSNLIEFDDTLRSRCKFILDIAEENLVQTLILGAFGCGVFGNSPRAVATIFKELLMTGNYTFSRVIFAIPSSKRDDNLRTFKDVFE